MVQQLRIFSRVAWALADDQKNVEVIHTWPGGGTRKFENSHWWHGDMNFDNV
jgi:hypothetical protein